MENYLRLLKYFDQWSFELAPLLLCAKMVCIFLPPFSFCCVSFDILLFSRFEMMIALRSEERRSERWWRGSSLSNNGIEVTSKLQIWISKALLVWYYSFGKGIFSRRKQQGTMAHHQIEGSDEWRNSQKLCGIDFLSRRFCILVLSSFIHPISLMKWLSSN